MSGIELEALQTAHEMVNHFGTSARIEYRAGQAVIPMTQVIADDMTIETADQSGALYTQKRKVFFMPLDVFQSLEATLKRSVKPFDKIHMDDDVYETVQGDPVEVFNAGMMQINTVKVKT